MSAVTFSLKPITFTEPKVASSEEMGLLIQDVARRCLLELGVSLVIGTVAASFVATPVHGAFIFAAIAVQTVCNAALRLAEGLATKLPPCKETEWIRVASPYCCMTMFAYLTAYNAQILLHEAGHAMAAVAMFQNANPQISFTPCVGGLTQFSTANLTALGKQLGRNKVMLVVTLMGPSCTLLISTIAMVVGYIIEHKFPELGCYLTGIGRGDFVAHSAYALTALSITPAAQAHDFVRLKAHGIHPLVSAIAIMAIPILIDRYFTKEE